MANKTYLPGPVKNVNAFRIVWASIVITILALFGLIGVSSTAGAYGGIPWAFAGTFLAAFITLEIVSYWHYNKGLLGSNFFGAFLAGVFLPIVLTIMGATTPSYATFLTSGGFFPGLIALVVTFVASAISIAIGFWVGGLLGYRSQK